MRVADGKTLRIAEAGQVLTLDYTGACAAHAGQSWFGVAVGFRMLQCAGEVLSRHGLWERSKLFILSDHPGAGVRDVIEYVTDCVARRRYIVRHDSTRTHCGRDTRYAWEISDGLSVALVYLHEEFISGELCELADRIGSPRERSDDAWQFRQLKRRLAEEIWQPPLERLFSVRVSEVEASRRA